MCRISKMRVSHLFHEMEYYLLFSLLCVCTLNVWVLDRLNCLGSLDQWTLWALRALLFKGIIGLSPMMLFLSLLTTLPTTRGFCLVNVFWSIIFHYPNIYSTIVICVSDLNCYVCQFWHEQLWRTGRSRLSNMISLSLVGETKSPLAHEQCCASSGS